ncbi:MAG: hypothetical protein IPL46_12900 [Saprospiraceae bacterium]|nr:hypothetical protein [Saprospiraceae bacterium]
MEKIYFSVILCLQIALAYGQPSRDNVLIEGSQVKELTLPKVFQIGEYEEQYGLLYEIYHDILLTVCNDDMNLAFDKWMNMISEMESYANKIDFDLNGVKIWLKVFWNEDGTIRYLSYYRKPNSRNIDPAELSAVLSIFRNVSQMRVKSTVKYTHNGSAQFPTAMIPAESRKN